MSRPSYIKTFNGIKGEWVNLREAMPTEMGMIAMWDRYYRAGQQEYVHVLLVNVRSLPNVPQMNPAVMEINPAGVQADGSYYGLSASLFPYGLRDGFIDIYVPLEEYQTYLARPH